VELFQIARPDISSNWLNRRIKMSELNCKVDDIAISVKTELVENIGNVMRVLRPLGYLKWYGFRNKTFVWEVEVASPDRPLIYEQSDGTIIRRVIGKIPDYFIRPIRPDELEKLIQNNERVLDYV
jgi:hypothetical protein